MSAPARCRRAKAECPFCGMNPSESLACCDVQALVRVVEQRAELRGAAKERRRTRAVVEEVREHHVALLSTADANRDDRRREFNADPSNINRHLAFRDAMEAVNVQLSIVEALDEVLRRLGARGGDGLP